MGDDRLPPQQNEASKSAVVRRVSTPPKFEVMDRIRREKPRPGEPIHVDIEVAAEPLERQGKRAYVRSAGGAHSTFDIRSDEAAFLGGDDSAPSPLSYLSAGVAFCFLTHLTTYIRKMGVDIHSVKVELRARFIKNTIDAAVGGQTPGGCEGLDLHVLVDSDKTTEEIARLVRVCRRACMALQSFINPVPTVTALYCNGDRLEVEEV